VPADGPGPAEHAELADSLSMAFLVLLEALSPVERAVFMLREVLGYGPASAARLPARTAAALRRSPPAPWPIRSALTAPRPQPGPIAPRAAIPATPARASAPGA
jgi:RNA polymerase sigma-70 factor (ECF subfamily)